MVATGYFAERYFRSLCPPTGAGGDQLTERAQSMRSPIAPFSWELLKSTVHLISDNAVRKGHAMLVIANIYSCPWK
jgi:hypothetical protein